MLAGSSLREEGVKGVVSGTNSFVRWHLPVRLDPMLKAVKLPAGIANLASGLANVNGDALTLKLKDSIFEAKSLFRNKAHCPLSEF